MSKTLTLLVLLAVFSGSALADDAPLDDLVSSKVVVVGEATLDFDKDGQTDRAVLVQSGATASVDLYIYFGAAGDTLAASRRPTLLKRDVASGAVVAIESGHNGGLTIVYGCGGCSNDTETKLRLAYRGGKVLIGGYTLDWDTRSEIGQCDINLLTGRGFVGHGLGNSGRPIKVRSGPIALSAWSDGMISDNCP